ncbi:MAG: ribonuclease P protein component [bacterium]|nr:ribonuclease P protein component [bacterium]
MRSAATFERLAREGRVVRRGALEFRYLLDGGDGPPRVAVAVPRRAGSAVVRNRLRRRLRAVMRELGDPARGPTFPSGDYLIRPRRNAASISFGRLREDAAAVLARVCGGGSS